jgi:CBS domain-containing protein
MNDITDAQLVGQTPGFRDLEPAALERLLAGAGKRRLGAGDTLFEVGQAFLDEVYIVRRGEIELERPDGRRETAAPGYLVGLSSYLGDSPYASGATARSDVDLVVLPASRLREAEDREPALFDAINRLIGTGLRARSVSANLSGSGLTQPAASIMSTPLSTCPPEADIRGVVAAMLRDNVGSVVVVGPDDHLHGMVTFRTLARYLSKEGVDPASEPVTNALQTVTAISGDTPLWQAQDIQERERSKYLVVTRDGRPVGMLSQTDIAPAGAGRGEDTQRDPPRHPAALPGDDRGRARVGRPRRGAGPLCAHHHGLRWPPGDDARSRSGQWAHHRGSPGAGCQGDRCLVRALRRSP